MNILNKTGNPLNLTATLNARGTGDLSKTLNTRSGKFSTSSIGRVRPKTIVSGSGGSGQVSEEKSPEKWLKDVETALKREKTYRKEAKGFIDIYEAEKRSAHSYNILFSNTDTLSPALFNALPRPIVKRRFDDKSHIAAAASKVLQRTLEYYLDDGMVDSAGFDDLMEAAVLSALIPGRGVLWFRYEADIQEAQADPEAGDGEGSEAGLPHTEEALETIESEGVCAEEIAWDKFIHGYAKRWEDVPWVGRIHDMSKEELKDNFPDHYEILKEKFSRTSDDDTSEDRRDTPLTLEVYEIWDRSTKSVIFVAKDYPEEFLKQIDDPLGLSGFFPCPRPLMFVRRISSLLPLPLYKLYEEQARELNRVSTRINKIVEAIKVRGFYDQTIPDLERLLQADDNTLVPVENVAALMAQNGTIEKAIFLMPIERLITVLQQLYLQRQQIKTVIFEITGLADIMRGSSQASETLGAQEIKNQWGTLRLKKSQKRVAGFVRDCLRIMAELSAEKLGLDTFQAMTSLPFPTREKVAEIQSQLQLMQQQAVTQAQMTGQPPQQPQLPPEVQEALTSPTWEDILEELRDDTRRRYSIDIETNSTVDAEATEDKQNIGELLNALAQYLNGVQPLVEAGSLPFEAAQGMMLAIVRRYRFGPELESQLEKMQPPKPKPDPKAEQAKIDVQNSQQEAQIRLQELQLNFQLAQQEHQFKLQELQMKMQMMQQKHQLDMERMQADVVMMRHSMQLEGQALAQKGEAQQQSAEIQRQTLENKAAAASQKPATSKD
jgi:hypothetical protein